MDDGRTRMSLTLAKVFQPFIKERPICVMARGVLENLLNPKRIDELFDRTARSQYTRDLLFSSVVDLMGQVVLGVQPSIHAAYQAQACIGDEVVRFFCTDLPAEDLHHPFGVLAGQLA